MSTALKTANRKKHQFHTQAYSLDAPLSDDGGSEPLHAILPCRTADEPLRVAQNMALRAAIIDGVMDAGLSEFEATVLLYRVQGFMYQEIADALGKSAKSIDNALQRLNAKLRRVLAHRLRPFLAA